MAGPQKAFRRTPPRATRVHPAPAALPYLVYTHIYIYTHIHIHTHSHTCVHAKLWGEGQCLLLPRSTPQSQLQCLGRLPQCAPQPLLHSGATLHLFCKEKSWQGLLLWEVGQWGPQLSREALQGTPGSGGRAGTCGAFLGRATLPRICRGPSMRTPDLMMAPDPACASSGSPGLLKRHCWTSSNTWNIS